MGRAKKKEKKKEVSKYKTTEKDFDIFKEEAQVWIDTFGLSGFSIDFMHKTYSAFKDAVACVVWDQVGRIATMYLSTDWEPIEVSETEVRRAAFHETMHILLANLTCLAESRYVGNVSQMDEAIHEIIMRLDNVLFSQSEIEVRLSK